MSKAILWVQHSLYLQDNPALLQAAQNHTDLAIVYVINTDNEYLNSYSCPGPYQQRYILDHVYELYKSLESKLFILTGSPHQAIERLCKKLGIREVYANTNHEPYWQKVYRNLDKAKVSLNLVENSLVDPSIKHYKVFTPFYQHVINNGLVNKPVLKNIHSVNFIEDVSLSSCQQLNDRAQQLPILEECYPKPGFKSALEGVTMFNALRKDKYHQKDVLYEDRSSNLSFYLSNHVISPRIVYKELMRYPKINQQITRQLIWGSGFNYQWLKHYPQLATKNYNSMFDHIGWCRASNIDSYKKWCNGCTGHDLVDAIMIQLNSAHYINNRARMIVASFLVKHLHIHWELGAKYFQEKLLDYDLANNAFNWQYQSSSLGSQIYSRRLSLQKQALLYDEENFYCNLWLPYRKGNPKPCYTYSLDKIKSFYKTASLYKNK